MEEEMKKLFLVLFMLVAVSFFTACFGDDEEGNPTVRIKTEGASITYGIRFGTAEFGPLANGVTTEYKEASSGSYYVLLKNSSGIWVKDTYITLGPLEDGNDYTLRVTSTSYYLNKD